MACTVCSNLRPTTLQQLRPGQVSSLLIDEYDLVQSARTSKCPECMLLFDALSLRKRVWVDKPYVSSIRMSINVNKPLRVQAWDGQNTVYIRIFRQPGDIVQSTLDATIPDTIGYATLIPQNSGSDKSLELMRKWYHDCASTHTLCQIDQQPLLPSRILDLGTSLASTADLSLYETQGSKGSFVALSYCWGNPATHRVLKTTQATIDDHKKAISFTALPLTIQHAVMLTRNLGFRYVWIDALCIVQDDAADWARESKKMCDIYGKAALTIIACKADGSAGGIFQEQEYSISTRLPYRGQHVSVSGDFQRDHQDNVEDHLNEIIDPIHLRAWTYQESILSTRAIYFTSQELRWECNSSRRCQCGQVEKSLPSSYDPEALMYDNYRIWRLPEFFPATVEEAYQSWYYIFSHFTTRLLTVEADRLVALAGLARRFATMMKTKFGRDEQYLAGIWAGSLPRDLLYRVQPKHISVRRGLPYGRPQVWRAPSWSWASMEASSGGDLQRNLQMRVKVLQAHAEPAGPDPYGQVKSGALHLEGPLLSELRFNLDLKAVQGTYERFPSVTYEGLDIRLMHIHFDHYLGNETERHMTDPLARFAILVVGYEPGGDTHEVLVLTPVETEPSTFLRYAWVQLGPHSRDSEEHREAVDNAPREAIILK